MKLILDFDRTLFAVERLYAALEAMGKPHLAGTLDSLSVLPIENYLYEDVRAFVQQFTPGDLYIVSSASGISGEWETDYQTAKIAKSGISDLVGEVHVIRGDKGRVAAEIAKQFPPSEPIIFVDDRIEHCLSVAAALPQVVCCLMVRDPAVIGATSTVRGVRVVHSLVDVNGIIESL